MKIKEKVCTFADHVKSKFYVVSSDEILKFEEITNNYILSSDAIEIDLGFGFADDLESAIKLAHKDFDEALAELDKNPDAAAVLLYHGVPDEPHPWCSTAWELFEKQMHHLAAAGYRVSSMANYGDLQ